MNQNQQKEQNNYIENPRSSRSTVQDAVVVVTETGCVDPGPVLRLDLGFSM